MFADDIGGFPGSEEMSKLMSTYLFKAYGMQHSGVKTKIMTNNESFTNGMHVTEIM